jgi:hypothetical protein
VDCVVAGAFEDESFEQPVANSARQQGSSRQISFFMAIFLLGELVGQVGKPEKAEKWQAEKWLCNRALS